MIEIKILFLNYINNNLSGMLIIINFIWRIKRKEENEKIEKDEEDNGLAMGMSLGMSIGMSIGVAVGAAIGNIPIFMCMGLCIGMSIGIAIGSVSKKDEKK